MCRMTRVMPSYVDGGCVCPVTSVWWPCSYGWRGRNDSDGWQMWLQWWMTSGWWQWWARDAHWYEWQTCDAEWPTTSVWCPLMNNKRVTLNCEWQACDIQCPVIGDKQTWSVNGDKGVMPSDWWQANVIREWWQRCDAQRLVTSKRDPWMVTKVWCLWWITV